MQLLQKLAVRLPDSWLDSGGSWLLRTGRSQRIPRLAMLLRGVEVMGGDPLEIQRALAQAVGTGDGLRDAFTELGLEVARAAEKTDDPGRSRRRYLRAGHYLLVASRASATEIGARERYRLAIRAFDRYRALQHPVSEKVLLDLEEMNVSGHVQAAPERTSPGLLLLHGSGGSKEWMTWYSGMAHRAGFTTLCIDLPGFGESGWAGDTLHGPGVLEEVTRSAVDLLVGRAGAEDAGVGVLGVGLGGFFAIGAAALDPRIGAVVSMGAPFDLAQRHRAMAAPRGRRALAWAGASDIEEFRRIVARFDIKRLTRGLDSAVLVVHGERDGLVPASQARRLCAAIGPRARLRIAPGEDHLCSGSLAGVLLPESLAWIRSRLML